MEYATCDICGQEEEDGMESITLGTFAEALWFEREIINVCGYCADENADSGRSWREDASAEDFSEIDR